MKRLALAVLLLIAISASRGFAADSGAVATLRLPYDKVLPGVPFDLEVTLKNTSRRPLKIGNLAYLHITRADGTEIALDPESAALFEASLDGPVEGPDGFIELAPGGSATRVIGWDNATPVNWFISDAFSGPGVYELQLELTLGAHFEDEDLSNYVGPLRTSSARLERAAPPGEDETLWNRMQEVSGGHWSANLFMGRGKGNELAREIIAVHPSSGYYPYALLLHTIGRGEKDIPVLIEAAERFRNAAVHPYLLKAAADAALSEASRADDQKDAARSARLYELAEKYYTAASQTPNLAVRAGAEHGLFSVRYAREKAANKPGK